MFMFLNRLRQLEEQIDGYLCIKGASQCRQTLPLCHHKHFYRVGCGSLKCVTQIFPSRGVPRAHAYK